MLSRTIITPPPNGEPPRNGPPKTGFWTPLSGMVCAPVRPTRGAESTLSDKPGNLGVRTPSFRVFTRVQKKWASDPKSGVWTSKTGLWTSKPGGPSLNPQKQARIRCGGQSLGFGPGFRPGSSVSSPSARLSYLPAANLYLTGTLQYTHTPQAAKDHLYKITRAMNVTRTEENPRRHLRSGRYPSLLSRQTPWFVSVT